MLGSVLSFYLSSLKLKRRIFHCISQSISASKGLVERVQKKWRREKELDVQRLEELKKMWDAAKAELRAQYTKQRDKKTLAKLNNLKDKTRDSLMKSHYANAKKRYAVMLLQWVRSSYTAEKQGRLSLVKSKYSSVKLGKVTEKPVFAPFPTKKEMKEKVLNSAGIALK